MWRWRGWKSEEVEAGGGGSRRRWKKEVVDLAKCHSKNNGWKMVEIGDGQRVRIQIACVCLPPATGDRDFRRERKKI